MAKTRSDKYQRTSELRERGIFGNVRERLINEQGTGASIGGSVGRGISETFGAKITGIKEMFDPLNIVRNLTGSRTATSLAGRIGGRSKADMRYFTDTRNIKTGGSKTSPVAGGFDSAALYSKVGEGIRPKLKSGDSVSDVLAKLYNLILLNNQQESKQRKLERNFRKEHESEKERRNKELIDALTGKKVTVTTVEKKSEGPSFFELIAKAIEGVKTWVDNFVNGLFGWLNPLKWLAELGSFEILAGKFLSFLRVGGALSALIAAAIAGYKIGENIVAPWIDSQIKLITKNPNATLGTWIESKFGPSKEVDKKLNSDNMELKIKSFEKKGSIEEDELTEMKKNMNSRIGTYKDMTEEQFQRVNKLVHISPASAQMKAATLLPDKEKRIYGKKADGGFGKISAASPAASSETPTLSPAPTAAPTAAEPSPVGARVQSAITQNEDLKMSENTTPQIIKMDNSKSTTTQGSGGPMIDSSVTVRTDDVSLQKITRQNLRPV